MKKLAIILLLCAAASFAEDCPVVIEKVNPHAYPAGAAIASGVSGQDVDPWKHYIQIQYKNESRQQLAVIRFGVSFVNQMGELAETVYYDAGSGAKPGKDKSPWWGDGLYWDRYGDRMRAVAWVEKIRYADSTYWQDDGRHHCSYGGLALSADSLAEMKQNSEASRSSEANAAALAEEGRTLTKEDLQQKIKDGTASKCAVLTSPPGADVYIDGNMAGKSPIAFVLIKRESPRVVKIKMEGYGTVEREYEPNGKTIAISIHLDKIN